MLRNLPGFAARPTATGYVLAPVDAPGHGVLRYHERVVPLARVSDLVAARLPAGFVETERSAIQALVTDETEDAARVTVAGSHGAHWVQRDFGFVFGDDFVVVVDGTCVDRGASSRFSHAATQVVMGVTLGMPLRRRRFRHAAPADRRPFVRGLETDWIGGDDVLTVFPAEHAEIEHLRVVAGRNGHVIHATTTIDGVVVTTAVGTIWRAVAGVADGGWLYLMELASARPRPLEPLLECLASRVRLPPRLPSTPAPFYVPD